MQQMKKIVGESTKCLARTARKKNEWWDRVRPAPEDPIIGVTEAFLSDSSPFKINLGEVWYIFLLINSSLLFS